MPMNNTTKSMLVLAFVAAGLGGWYAYHTSNFQPATDAAQVLDTPTPVIEVEATSIVSGNAAPRVDPPVALAYAMLNKGASMKSTLDQIAGPDGKIRSPELATLIQTTDAACSDVRTNEAHYLEDTSKDPSRSWATTRLLEICHEFNASKYTFDFPKDGLTRVVHEQSAERSVQASLEAIRRESDPSELYTAGQILLEKDKGKLLASLTNAAEYGDLEVMKAWALATTMLTCSEAGGCGPNSVQTAAFCANTGCRPGSDFSQAIRQRLPENEYRAVNAFYSWMSNLRRS
jgi:hypothetical protein